MGFFTCPNTGVNIYDNQSYLLLKEAAKISFSILQEAVSYCREGITTLELETFISKRIEESDCLPAFKGYDNFPFTSCLSVGEHIVHGIASDRILIDGDVVSIDLGVIYKGHYADNAETVIIGSDKSHVDLINIAKSAFSEGYKAISRNAATTGDIGFNIHKTVVSVVTPGGLATKGDNVFNIFARFEGHGIGNDLHEYPNVPNTGYPGKGVVLREGMCFCIEPVIVYSSSEVVIYQDQVYNVKQFVTKDKKPSSHFERQVFITANGPEIITI